MKALGCATWVFMCVQCTCLPFKRLNGRPPVLETLSLDASVSRIVRPGRSPLRSYSQQSAYKLQGLTLSGTTDSSVWPQPASLSHADITTWKLLADSSAAVSADCPYVAHGNGSSAASCQQDCDTVFDCNLVNFNDDIGDCVLRSCADPFKPVLTPTVGYDVYAVEKPLYALEADFSFVSSGFSSDLLAAALRRYTDYTFVYGSPARQPNATSRVNGLCVAVMTDNTQLSIDTDESYNMSIRGDTEGLRSSSFAGCPFDSQLTAVTVFGAMHGLETWSQLVQYNVSSGAYSVPYADVIDYPRFPFRGVLLDPARHYLPVPVIERVVDVMAALKLNALHLHITDDQSWPLNIAAFPDLAQQGSFSTVAHSYSAADVTGLVQYALERGVRVIPEFDSPAHTGTLTRVYPSLAATAFDSNNVSFPCLVDPSRPSTFTALKAIWRDIASMFSDDTVALGGDEFWPCWDSSPSVVAWMPSQGLNGSMETYYWYERSLINISRSLGRKSLLWQDVAGFPLGFNESQSYADYADVTVLVWSGCYSGSWQDGVATFTSQNASTIVAGPFYVTVQNGAPSTPHFTWEQMYATDVQNFTGAASASQAQLQRVHGGLLALWGDATESDAGDVLLQMTPNAFGVSEAWWSPAAWTQAAVSSGGPDGMRAHAQRCRMLQRGLPSHPIFGAPYEPVACIYEFGQPQTIAALSMAEP